MLNTAKIIHRYVKARKGKDPQEKVERNSRLYSEYRRRKFIVPLVAKYQISSQRIFQIVKQVERWGGVKKKTPALTAAQLLIKRKRAIERFRARRRRVSRTRRKSGATPHAFRLSKGHGKEPTG